MRSFLLTGLWGLNMHKSRTRSNMFKGSSSRNTANRTTERALRANQLTNIGTIPADEAPHNWFIRHRCSKTVCEIDFASRFPPRQLEARGIWAKVMELDIGASKIHRVQSHRVETGGTGQAPLLGAPVPGPGPNT